MAYADTLRSTAWAGTDAATLIEGLLISKQSLTTNGLQSTTSASLVAIPGASLTVVVPAGGLVLLICSVQLGVSAASVNITIAGAEDGTQIAGATTPRCISTINDAVGRNYTVPYSVTRLPSAGSHTYTLLYAVAGGNTLAMGEFSMELLLLRNS
jgi:hypothetical protein